MISSIFQIETHLQFVIAVFSFIWECRTTVFSLKLFPQGKESSHRRVLFTYFGCGLTICDRIWKQTLLYC